MENYNYHRIGRKYYEDKRKSVKKKNNFVSFGISLETFSYRIPRNYARGKNWSSVWREFHHENVTSKITRKHANKIETLLRFWHPQFTNRILSTRRQTIRSNVSIPSRLADLLSTRISWTTSRYGSLIFRTRQHFE